MNSNNKDFLASLQKNIAFLCIDISVLRNQSKPGSVEKCRRFCSEIDIEMFFDSLKNNYHNYLEKQTEELLNYGKSENLKFGSARKVLNIFFRHITYSGFFQNAFLLNQDVYSDNSILAKLELPIDSRIAKKLSNKRWVSIIALSKKDHQEYQDLALDQSKKCGIARIHLDIKYWTPV